MNLREAAELAGVSYATFRRRVEDGTVSVSRKANGTITVDPSEVIRAFPEAKTAHEQPKDESVIGHEHSKNMLEQQLRDSQKLCKVYEEEVAYLRNQLHQANERLDKALSGFESVKAIAYSQPKSEKGRVRGVLDKILS